MNNQIKNEPFDNNDKDIEILNEISTKNENRNYIMNSVKSEFNATTNRQIESKKDETIKKLEQIQETLFERIRIKSNENEILKQNEYNLKSKNSELNRIIEMNTNNQMNLSYEIISLKEKIFEANETIEIKKNDIIDLKFKIDKYESKINEMNQKFKGK